MTSCLEISAPATLASVRAVRGKVAEIAARVGAEDQVVDDVRLCVGEAVTNAVVHGYGPEDGTVDVTVELARDELTVVVSDEGKGVTSLRGSAEDGYGLRIIERLTLRYLISSAPNVGTEVRMIFPLPAVGARQRPRDLASLVRLSPAV